MNGLVLPVGMNTRDEDGTPLLFGGVAVKCSTRSSVMKLATTLQLMKPGGMTSMTESGILIQNSSESAASVSTAVVLPLDIDIWQTALMVFGAEDLYELEQ
jgi:hypothetical protein